MQLSYILGLFLAVFITELFGNKFLSERVSPNPDCQILTSWTGPCKDGCCPKPTESCSTDGQPTVNCSFIIEAGVSTSFTCKEINFLPIIVQVEWTAILSKADLCANVKLNMDDVLVTSTNYNTGIICCSVSSNVPLKEAATINLGLY